MQKEAIMEYLIIDGQAKKVEECDIFNKIQNSPIYEVVRVIDGKEQFIKDHIQRMFASFELLGYGNEYDEDEIIKFAKDCIVINGIKDNNIKLLAVELNNGQKVFMVYAIESYYPPDSVYKEGIKTILFKHSRNNPNAKVQHLDYKTAVTKAIKDSGAYEALLLNEEGYILEGSRSNMFYVMGERIFTAPASKVLLGITRKHIINVITDLEIPFEEKELSILDLKSVEGIFISGTSIGVLPVKSVDDILINSPDNNVIKKILDEYNRLTGKILG